MCDGARSSSTPVGLTRMARVEVRGKSISCQTTSAWCASPAMAMSWRLSGGFGATYEVRRIAARTSDCMPELRLSVTRRLQSLRMRLRYSHLDPDLIRRLLAEMGLRRLFNHL